MHAIRWWTVFFLISMLLVVPSFAQESSEPKDTLYSMALVAAMQREWGSIDDGDSGSRVGTDYRHLIVRKNPEITDDLPSQSDEFHFDYLDDASLLARYDKVKKGFSILEVHPIHDEGPLLRIHVSQSWVDKDHGHLAI